MSTRSRRLKLDYLPGAVKALIAKILANTDSFQGIAEWLQDEHGIKASISTVWRFSKTVHAKHGGLLELGIPAEVIAGHHSKLETLGAFLVQRELLNLRIAELLAAVLAKPTAKEGKP